MYTVALLQYKPNALKPEKFYVNLTAFDFHGYFWFVMRGIANQDV